MTKPTGKVKNNKGKKNPIRKPRPTTASRRKEMRSHAQLEVRLTKPIQTIQRHANQERIPAQLEKQARKYIKQMLMADSAIQFPRLIPVPSVPARNFGRMKMKLYQQPDTSKGQTRDLILRCTPNLLNPVERFIIVEGDTQLADTPQIDINRNWMSNNASKIYFDANLVLSPARKVLASGWNQAGAQHWSSSTKSFKPGAKYYPCKPAFDATYNGLGTIYNPDSAVMQLAVTVEIIQVEGDVHTVIAYASTSDNYASKTTSGVGGSASWRFENGTSGQTWAQAAAHLTTAGAAVGASGFAVSFTVTNAPTVGNIPSGFVMTLNPSNITIDGYGVWEPFAWVTPAVIKTSIDELLASDQFAYNAMAVLVQNQTPKAFEGGSIIVAQIPADDQWRVPNTPLALQTYLFDAQTKSRYEGPAKDGGHWSLKFQTLDQLHWKNEHPRDVTGNDTLSYPYGYFYLSPAYVSGSLGATECDFMIWTNLAYELITTTQARPLLEPLYDRFGLVAAFIASLAEFNTCGCNPDHFTKIKNAVVHVMKDPRVRSVLSTMAKAGVTALMAAV